MVGRWGGGVAWWGGEVGVGCCGALGEPNMPRMCPLPYALKTHNWELLGYCLADARGRAKRA